MNTQEICKSLFFERTQNTTNAFFPNAARDLLAAIIIAFVRAGIADESRKRKYFYNNELKMFLDLSDRQMLIDFLKTRPDTAAIISYIANDSPQSQGVISEMYSIIREIFVGSTLTPVYRLLFDLALKEALGRNQAQGNVYLICDEFKLLPHLRHIDDGVNFGRSLGVKVFAGVQSIEQLYEIYGQSRGRNIAAGFSSVYAFRSNDTATREFVSGMFGKNIVLEKYQMSDNRIVEEKRNGQTVEDWDLNSLKVGEAIVGLPFAPPFRFYFDEY